MKIRFKSILLTSIIIITLIVLLSTNNFYQNTYIPNDFKTKNMNIKMEEEFNNTWGMKKVFFENQEIEKDVVLRINYNEIWKKNIDGVNLYLDNNVDGENVVEKEWTKLFMNDFIKMSDGWYYYKKILHPKDKIQILESISLKDDLIKNSTNEKDYKKYEYDLVFHYEALEADKKIISKIWNQKTNLKESDNIWE